MTGTYPITIDGVTVGKLTVTRQGLLTVFEADMPDTGTLCRLSVYGEREGYLGLMVPDGKGRQRLCRRLSRAALRDFPETISAVGPAGHPAEDVPADTDQSEAAQEPACREAAQEPETEPPPEPPDAEAGEMENEDLLWFSTPDGTLVSFDGSRSLVALPIGDKRLPAGTQGAPRQIAGKNYLVFQTRNGRIL